MRPKKPREIHGEARPKLESPEYHVWHSMLGRCYCESDTNYRRYGQRGIQVCSRWQNSFIAFLQDMGRRPSAKHQLDRINNLGNYEPSNCRWATSKEQNRNRRGNCLITINGITKCIAEWAEEAGLKPGTLRDRFRNGWPIEKLLIHPQSVGRWTRKGFKGQRA